MSNQRALLLDDVGLGKTAQALVAASSLGAKTTLVLCPPATRYGWEAEAKKWTTRQYNIHVMTREKEWIPEGVNILVVSYSLLNSPMIIDQLKSMKWSVTICDEIHYCKNGTSKRSKTILGRGGLISKSVYFWGLTATPLINAPIDLWQVFRSMGKAHLPEKQRDWMGYTRRYCKRFKSHWGRWDTTGAANLDELKQCLYGTGFAVRRTKSEVLTELPEKTLRLMPLDGDGVGPAHMKWDKLRDSKVRLGLGGAEIAEARRDLGMAKLDAVVEYVLSIEEPVVVFGWHQEFLRELSERTNGVLYYGAMSPAQKERAKAQFIAGKAPVFAANLQSAGTGLDGLQHVSDHCVFAELPWTYTEIDQATGRLHRMGQKNHVLCDMLVEHGGVEEYMMKTILRKEGHSAAVVG